MLFARKWPHPKDSRENKLLVFLSLTLPSPPLFPLRGAVERELNSETYLRASPKHRSESSGPLELVNREVILNAMVKNHYLRKR